MTILNKDSEQKNDYIFYSTDSDEQVILYDNSKSKFTYYEPEWIDKNNYRIPELIELTQDATIFYTTSDLKNTRALAVVPLINYTEN